MTAPSQSPVPDALGAAGGGLFTYGGMRFYASDLLPTDTVEDWSEVRSPSRAARRRRQGHPQRIIYRQVPRDEVFVMGDRAVMPPHLLAKLRAAIPSPPAFPGNHEQER